MFFFFLPTRMTIRPRSSAREARRAIGLISSRRTACTPLLFFLFPVATNGQDNEQRERRWKTNGDLFVHYAGIFSQWSNRSCTTIRVRIISPISLRSFHTTELHVISIKVRTCKTQHICRMKNVFKTYSIAYLCEYLLRKSWKIVHYQE